MFQRFPKRAVVALALAASLLMTSGCRASKPGEGHEVVPELKLEEVRFRVHRGDALRAFGEARVATFRRDSTDLAASDVVATLPGEPAPVRVTAPSAQGVASDRVFSASGGVVVRRGDDVARTETARYEPGSGGGRVAGDDPVRVDGRGYRLEGTGFTLDPVSGDISVGGGVRVLAGVEGER